MARNALMTLACVSLLLTMTGCVARMLYGKPDTALVVVNNTSKPITVIYDQSADNTDGGAITNSQEVVPGYSTRFVGVEGDHLSVLVGDEPPLTIEYSDRSQVIEATDDGVTFRKGFNEPDRDGD